MTVQNRYYAIHGWDIAVIFYFTRQEQDKVNRILKDLKMINDPNVILIGARKDNKPSGSKA